MVLGVEPLCCTWQSCARLGGRGSSPALLPPSTGRPSLTRSISAVAFGGVTSGRGRLPSALLSSFIPYSQQDACFVTPVPPPEQLWSLLQRQQEVTTTPGPHPSGAARKETRLSLNPAVPRCRWIPRQSPSGSIGRPAPAGPPEATRGRALCQACLPGTRVCALRSCTAHWSFICDFQTSDSSAGATATSGLTDVRKSRHGAKVHEFWLGKTSRLGNLDIWEPPSMPSQALSQEDGRTAMVRTSLERQDLFYFRLRL